MSPGKEKKLLDPKTKHRAKIADTSWFKKSRHLAIADVVYVANVGICSHQPEDPYTEKHRMLNVQGHIHFANDEDLFRATIQEVKWYWGDLNEPQQSRGTSNKKDKSHSGRSQEAV